MWVYRLGKKNTPKILNFLTFPKAVFDCQYFQKMKLIKFRIYWKVSSQNYKSLEKYRGFLRVSKSLYEKVKIDVKNENIRYICRMNLSFKLSATLNNFFKKTKKHI